MHIASVDKLPLSTTGSPLLIRTKTFLSVTYVFPRERECHDVYQTLIKLHQPGEFETPTNWYLYRAKYYSRAFLPFYLFVSFRLWANIAANFVIKKITTLFYVVTVVDKTTFCMNENLMRMRDTSFLLSIKNDRMLIEFSIRLPTTSKVCPFYDCFSHLILFKRIWSFFSFVFVLCNPLFDYPLRKVY